MSLGFLKTVTHPRLHLTRLHNGNLFVHLPHRALRLELPARSSIRRRHPIFHARVGNPCPSVAFASRRQALWPRSIQSPLVMPLRHRRHHIVSLPSHHQRVSNYSAQRWLSPTRAPPIRPTRIKL